jgi:cysteine sulfinate desulfinase/cysteine desulfurase-like protein
MCMYFWAHTDNIVTVLSCMYEQKDTYTYRHHTDMSVSDTYMSVLHKDKSECVYICLNVYVSDSHMDSIVFVLSLYDVCISGTETCILSVSCQYYT